MVSQGRVHKGVSFMKIDLRNLLEVISVMIIVVFLALIYWVFQEGYKEKIIEENETIELEPNGRSGISNEIILDFATITAEANDDIIVGVEEPEELKTEEEVDAFLIRCTSYLVTGTTASGEYTRYGILAGKRDWLYKNANLYSVNEEGNIGEHIGTFQFLDTGAGIDTDGDGYGDSIINGLSIDVWQPNEEAMNQWIGTYGDYVYLELLD